MVELNETNVVLKNTPAKYEKMKDELVPLLFGLLDELDSLERGIFTQDREMDNEKTAMGIPSHIAHPDFSEFISGFRANYGAIIDKRVSEKLKAYGYAGSFGSPTKYYYVKSGAFLAEFTMRKDDMASIVVHYKHHINGCAEKKHKFVLRLIDGAWLVDEKYWGFDDEKSWHKDTF